MLTSSTTIVISHRIDLVGWTAEKFCNPSDLSNSLPPLEKLLDALMTGACRFVRLSSSEYAERKEKFDAAVESGVVPMRKKWKDAGTKRMSKKRKRVDENVEESGGVAGEDGDGENGDGDGDGGPRRTRRRGEPMTTEQGVNLDA
ncbi:hypothetical protein A0H81_14854 [Grifola frondosa]|uniref:Uncharacterized protein n=1 Tax=Grifola frondosa TaxID=5627 RepID=A0A1C7LKE8_GRIFR|nr:hypothetical protein A0H81_14854 [Grifola frondosa]